MLHWSKVFFFNIDRYAIHANTRKFICASVKFLNIYIDNHVIQAKIRTSDIVHW